MGSKVGLELELWAINESDGIVVPADAVAIASKVGKREGVGHVTTEPGQGALELVSAPSASIAEAVQHIRTLRALVAPHAKMLHRMLSPFSVPKGPQNLKPRWEALWQASELEAGKEGAECLNLLNAYAATHIHESFDGYEISKEHVDDKIVVAVSSLVAAGPFLARTLCNKYGVTNTGHFGIWGFARGERSSQYGDWNGSFAQKKANFEKLPRFIKCVSDEAESGKEGGLWAPDLVEAQKWSDLLDHSNSWHIVRERPNFGTIEVRLLPSWPLETLELVVNDVHDFILHVLDIAPKGVGLTSYAEMRKDKFWQYLCNHKIGGEKRLPRDYDKNMWNAHVFS